MLVSGRWTRLSTNRHRLPPLPSHFGQYWYPLDFLPNYLARKCFIIYAYEAGTVLMNSISTDSLPRCQDTFELGGWGKQKYSLLLKACTAKALFWHDRSVGVSVLYSDWDCSTSAVYWLAGWCTYGLLRHLERVHPSLKPLRYLLYLMSVVKNITSKKWLKTKVTTLRFSSLRVREPDPNLYNSTSSGRPQSSLNDV